MKVLELHGGSCEHELQTLRDWLEMRGCEVIVFDMNRSGGRLQEAALIELIDECETLVLMINAELPLSDVNIAVLAANAKGKKVVGVRLGKTAAIDALEKYGSTSVPFDRNLILDAVCADRFSWIDDDGEAREEPDTERHKCKKQKSNNNAAA